MVKGMKGLRGMKNIIGGNGDVKNKRLKKA